MKVCQLMVNLHLNEDQKVTVEDYTSRKVYVGTDPYYPEWTTDVYNYVMSLTVKSIYVSDSGIKIYTEYNNRNRK